MSRDVDFVEFVFPYFTSQSIAETSNHLVLSHLPSEFHSSFPFYPFVSQLMPNDTFPAQVLLDQLGLEF